MLEGLLGLDLLPGRAAARVPARHLRVAGYLLVDPALPVGIGRIELLDIPGRWGRVDAFGRGRVDVDRRTPLRPQLADAGRRADR